jgi:hypothetical protein
MTAQLENRPGASSRRALLAGALGGLGAWAAGAIGRTSTVRAEGQAIVVGGEYSDATSVTRIQNSANNGPVIEGQSSSGTGIYGLSATGAGVRGISTSGSAIWGTSSSATALFAQSSSGIGVYGTSSTSYGVYGKTNATLVAATVGHGAGDSTGVHGFSGAGALIPPKAKTGVYGYANQDSSAKGVVGESSKGYAGFFLGKVYTSKWHEMTEISTPTAPGSSRARIFLRDNGSAKTELCVRFHSGAVQVLATQP